MTEELSNDPVLVEIQSSSQSSQGAKKRQKRKERHSAKSDWVGSEAQIETIRSCITKVATAMGQGRRESVYQHALKIELALQLQRPCMLEYPLPILYNNERVGVSYIDLLVPNMFFVEVKSTTKLSRKDVLQTMAYARDLNLTGILVNFSQGTASASRSSRSSFDLFEMIVVNGHSVVKSNI